MKKIIIGSDASGYELKEVVKAYLAGEGFEVEDVGTTDPENPVDFWDAGFAVGKAVSEGKHERGIVLCGTGQGITLAANKYPGVLCGLCESVFAVNRARTFNNINVLGLGGFLQGPVLAIEMVKTFLETEWKQGQDAGTGALLERGYKAMLEHDKEVFK